MSIKKGWRSLTEMGPDISFPQSVRSIWWLIWRLQNQGVCCGEKEKNTKLLWEVNIGGDQKKKVLQAVICTVSDRTSNLLAGFSPQPRTMQLPTNELGKNTVFTFKVAVVGLSFPSSWLESP